MLQHLGTVKLFLYSSLEFSQLLYVIHTSNTLYLITWLKRAICNTKIRPSQLITESNFFYAHPFPDMVD